MMNLAEFPTTFSGKYGKGFIPSNHDRSTDLSVRALLGGTVRLSSGATLEQYIAAVYNQLQSSSCVGWALAQCIAIRCAVLGTPIVLPSPEALYVFARAIARLLSGATAAQTPLEDTGCMPSLAFQGANQWGVPSNTVWPFSLETINDPPNLEQLEVASAFKLTGYYAISDTGNQRLVDIKQAIAAGYPVFIGTAVDEAFEAYEGGRTAAGVPNTVTAPVESKIVGGHGLTILGFQQFGNRSLVRGINQWGTGWGDAGLFWADESFLTTPYLTDGYVLTVNATGHTGLILSKNNKLEVT